MPWHCSALSRCGGFCSVWSSGTRRKLTLQVTALLDMPRAEWLCRSYDERAVLITRSGRPSFWPSNAEAHFRSGALKSVGVDRRHVDFVFAREEPKLRGGLVAWNGLGTRLVPVLDRYVVFDDSSDRRTIDLRCGSIPLEIDRRDGVGFHYVDAVAARGLFGQDRRLRRPRCITRVSSLRASDAELEFSR